MTVGGDEKNARASPAGKQPEAELMLAEAVALMALDARVAVPSNSPEPWSSPGMRVTLAGQYKDLCTGNVSCLMVRSVPHTDTCPGRVRKAAV